jgi:tetratricopeptide (TPR) repeat protein
MNETDSAQEALARARALCDLRRYNEAVTMARRAIAMTPDDAKAWCVLAQALISAEGDNAGLDAARKAAALSPEDEWPHRLQSIALRHLKRNEQALAAAARAVQVAPFTWQAHSEHALTLALAREKEAAEAAATTTLNLAPNRADAWAITGDAAAIIDDGETAAARYRNALRLDPQNASAHSGLARLQLRKGGLNPSGLADAASGFARAIRSDPRGRRRRDTIDALLRVFLGRASYFFFVVCYIDWRTSDASSSPAARWIPVLLMVAPAVFVVRFLTRLDAAVRARLFRQLRHGLVGGAAAADAGAALAILAGAVMPTSARPGTLGTAVFLALFARIALYVERRLEMPEMFEARARWRVVAMALAIGLGLVGVLFVLVGGSDDSWRVTGAGVAALVVAAAMAVPLLRAHGRR